MSEFDWKLPKKENRVRIVYTGRPMAGKTTNLEKIWTSIAEARRGHLMPLAREGDRLLYFECQFPHPSQPGEMGIQFVVIPGVSYYRSTRSFPLEEADGVVFVVDSRRGDQVVDTLQYLAECKYHLLKRDKKIPFVFQWNKRDEKNLYTRSELRAIYNPWRYPEMEATAREGRGVLETAGRILQEVEGTAPPVDEVIEDEKSLAVRGEIPQAKKLAFGALVEEEGDWEAARREYEKVAGYLWEFPE